MNDRRDGDYAPVRGVRIPFVRRCVIQVDGQAVDAMLCNLSVVGTYITLVGRSHAALPREGQEVRVFFRLPQDPTLVETDAVVALYNVGDRREILSLPSGCGLRFTSLTTGDHHRIGEVVHDYRYSRHPRSSVPRPYSGLIRVPHIQPCRLTREGDALDGVLCNVSLTGAYAAVDPQPRVGERVALSFTVSGTYPIAIDAKVMWVNSREPRHPESLPPGCGLRFLDLEESNRAHLEHLVEEHDSLPRQPL